MKIDHPLGFKTNKAQNKCPVCGKVRSSTSTVNHGKCAEEMARRDKEKTVKLVINGQEKLMSKDNIRASSAKRTAKHGYAKGRLPDWMFS